MPDYFHSALRGNQLHEAKIKVLPAGSPIPVPEWEGQFVAVGTNLYYSVFQDNTLVWQQPTASNIPVLPANVVVFEEGTASFPPTRTGSGRIYANTQTKDIWYLSGSQWFKLGLSATSSTFEIISGRAATNWQGNYFGLLNPDVVSQDNCLLIKKWQLATKYYLAIESPTMSSLGGSDDNLFYFELWRNVIQTILSTHAEAKESLAIINTSLFTSLTDAYRLGMYIKRNGTKLYLNFTFNLDSRLIKIERFANISYGY